MNDRSDFVLTLDEYTGADSHVEIPEGVIKIGYDAFKGNRRLKSVYIPEGVIRIGNNAFANCISLRELTLPASLRFWPWGAFSGCSSLRRIRVPAGSWVRQIPDILGVPAVDMDGKALPPVAVSDDGWLYEELFGEVTILGRKSTAAGTLYHEPYCQTTLYIPDSIAGMPVTAIGKHAFAGDVYIDALYLPDGLRTIGEGAFANCEELVLIRLPESLEHIGGGAFHACVSLDIRIKERMHAIDDGYVDDDDDDDDDDVEYEAARRIWHKVYDDDDDGDDDDGDDDDGDDEDEAPVINYKNVIPFRPLAAAGVKPELDRFRVPSKPTPDKFGTDDQRKKELRVQLFRVLSRLLLSNLGLADKDVEKLYEHLKKREKVRAVTILLEHSPDRANCGLKWAKEIADALQRML